MHIFQSKIHWKSREITRKSSLQISERCSQDSARSLKIRNEVLVVRLRESGYIPRRYNSNSNMEQWKTKRNGVTRVAKASDGDSPIGPRPAGMLCPFWDTTHQMLILRPALMVVFGYLYYPIYKLSYQNALFLNKRHL